jgi:hypothetical protein
MNRRDFLKLGGLVSTALLVQFNLLGSIADQPIEVEWRGNQYRGTSDGKIMISPNEGKTWQLHTNFGSEFAVRSLMTDIWGQVNVQLEFAGYSFDLVLAQNGKIWKTA